MDSFSKEKRSEIMAKVRSQNTKAEIRVRKHLHGLGFRYRLGGKVEGVKPDVVLPKWRTCIFVHGCYWHRHKRCKRTTTPQTNREYWTQKFRRNVARDRRTLRRLAQAGWKCGVIWECAVKDGRFADRNIKDLVENATFWEIS